ncbi:MAG: hypothetical protein KAH95_13565 [Spirochaetales bacterium]|nr:hypothetical protein [Spirochaetales bacterium]
MSTDYLELAQDLIDSNKKIPNEILFLMNSRERQIITEILKMKEQFKDEIENFLPKKNLYLKNIPNSFQRRFRPNLKFLYAAAAILIALIYFPVNRSIETRILIKEDTARFVDQLFQENEESYLLADIGITEDWFDSNIIPVF